MNGDLNARTSKSSAATRAKRREALTYPTYISILSLCPLCLCSCNKLPVTGNHTTAGWLHPLLPSKRAPMSGAPTEILSLEVT
jgi:hypothetical protein